MKKMIAIAAVAFLASCGNSTESTTVTNDSTTVGVDTIKVSTDTVKHQIPDTDTLVPVKTITEEKK